jgi:hypothetical protein
MLSGAWSALAKETPQMLKPIKKSKVVLFTLKSSDHSLTVARLL